ncbi:Hypothetical predicted protein, partial [Pelobates cultripes]
MTTIRLISENAKGLNTPEKRSLALTDFHRQKAEIVFIQETHFCKDSAPTLRNRRYPTGYFSHFTGAKARGVGILMGSQVPFTFNKQETDKAGRYIFVSGTI